MIDNCANIKLNVQNSLLTIAKNYDATTHTVGAVKVCFDFKTADWTNLTKTVVFIREGQTPLTQVLASDSNSCVVPWEIFQCSDNTKPYIEYEVGIYGVGIGGDRLPTNRVKLKIKRSCYCQGDTPSSPTPTTYEQLVAQIAALNNLSIGDVSEEILQYCTNADFASKDYVDDAIAAIDTGIMIETDPTVPNWAKQPAKPTYTATEVGALPSDTVIPPAYNDTQLRNLIANEANARAEADAGKANAYHTHDGYVDRSELAGHNYATQSEVSDAIAAIPTPDVSGQIAAHNTSAIAHSDIRANIPTKISDLVNDSGYLTEHQSLNGYATENYVTTAIGAIPVPDVSGQISTHNSNAAAHSDIRTLISDIATRLNALANSDDTTLDQLAEIVSYIKSNRSLIESVTTSKINVADIINTLDSTNTAKPLSAAQGKVLNDLLTELSASVASHKSNHQTGGVDALTPSDIGAVSISDLTPYATKTYVDDAIPAIPTDVSAFTNDANYITIDDVPDSDNIILDLGGTSAIPHTFTALEAEAFYNQLMNALDENDNVVKNIYVKLNEDLLIGGITNNYLPCTVTVTRILGPDINYSFNVSFCNTYTDNFNEYNLLINSVGRYTAVLTKSDIAPHIGDNGNWYINTTDTGVPAQGDSGVFYGTTQPTEENHPLWIDPNGEADGVIKYTEEQELTPEQMQMVRDNIDAVSDSDVATALIPKANKSEVANSLRKTVSGAAIRMDDVSPLVHNLSIVQYGQCVQNGTPTPEAPVEITGKAAGGKVYGEIIEWNQYISIDNFRPSITTNGITFTTNGDGTITANGTATGTAVTYVPVFGTDSAHKFLLRGCPVGGSSSTYHVFNGYIADGIDTGEGVVLQSSHAPVFYVRILSGVTVSDLVFKPQVFDLTQMYGEGHEPTVAEFRAVHPDDYYPYDAGTDMAVSIQTVTDSNGDPVTLYGKPVASRGNVTIGTQQYVADTLEGNIASRRIGMIVIDGINNRVSSVAQSDGLYYAMVSANGAVSAKQPICTHFKGASWNLSVGYIYITMGHFFLIHTDQTLTTTELWNNWLVAQNEAGTPVTVYYELETPTTETVTISPSTLPAKSPTTTWLSDAYTEVTYNQDTNKSLITNVQAFTDSEKQIARTNIGAIGTGDYATSETAGIVSVNSANGVYTSAGALKIQRATDENISGKTNAFRPIVPSSLDYAVRAGLLSNSQITSADYDAICTTIGAERKHGDYELIEEITLTEDTASVERTMEPDGTLYNFSNLYVSLRVPAASTAVTVVINFYSHGSYIRVPIAQGVATGVRKYWAEIFPENGFYNCKAYKPSASYANMSEMLSLPEMYRNALVTNYTINKIIFSFYDAEDRYPSDTVIQIYGVRA